MTKRNAKLIIFYNTLYRFGKKYRVSYTYVDTHRKKLNGNRNLLITLTAWGCDSDIANNIRMYVMIWRANRKDGKEKIMIEYFMYISS